MNLLNITQQFSSEESCMEYLERRRWPDGITCPTCKGRRISRFNSTGKTGRLRRVIECLDCRVQFTPTSGTLMHDSHLPLVKWFIAIALICESKKGISANQVARAIGVQYRTAWYLCHRIRAAMRTPKLDTMDGVVEVDEVYLAGKPALGRPRRKKDIVIGLRQRGGELRFVRTRSAGMHEIHDIVHENISPDVQTIMTDESHIYNFDMTRYQGKHKQIKHSETYAIGTVHTNSVESAFSLLQRGIVGTYHRLSSKHLDSYLDEFSYRFNQRKRQPEMFGKVTERVMGAPCMTYRTLTTKPN